MIGKITGRVDHMGADHVLIDVGGVGYVVYCSDRTLAALPPPGGMAALYTDLLVREDNLQLFGFSTLAEKEWHRLLTSVQGVGAKVALAIAGTLGVEGTSRAITLGDAAAVRAAPGVGPKLAQRIVSELKDKAAGVIAMGAQGAVRAAPSGAVLEDADVSASKKAEPAAPSSASPAPDLQRAEAAAQADALSALLNLGYTQSEAAQAVAESAPDAAGDGSGALIRAALKRLAPQ